MRNLKIDIAEDTVSKIQRIHSETEAITVSENLTDDHYRIEIRLSTN